MPAVKVSDLNDGSLAFDLGELLEVIADVGPQLEWRLHQLWLVESLTVEWPGGDALEEASAGADGVALAWTQLADLPKVILQTIDGEFLGYRPGEEHAEVALFAVDSSYWVVAARREDILERFRGRFRAVESCDEPELRQRQLRT